MKRILPILALGSAAALVLAGCSGAADEQPAASAGLSIVASTSVYGDIAATIAGDHATVTSIIDDPSVDPHSFEASARDQLAIADADLIIANGGGYDPFMEALISASGTSAAVIEAVVASELLDHDHADGAHDHADDHDHAEDDHAEDEHAEGEHAGGEHEGHDHIEGFNEHVWYSLHGMAHVVHEIAHELAEIDPENAADYEANAEALEGEIGALETRADEIATSANGATVAVTEPVAVYLLEAAGLTNVTPDAFTEAIEEGNDVPPLALQQTLDLFSPASVILLAYNEQTASSETERVRGAAENAGVPVVQFTETLPDGADYVSWMSENLEAIAAVVIP